MLPLLQRQDKRRIQIKQSNPFPPNPSPFPQPHADKSKSKIMSEQQPHPFPPKPNPLKKFMLCTSLKIFICIVLSFVLQGFFFCPYFILLKNFLKCYKISKKIIKAQKEKYIKNKRKANSTNYLLICFNSPH